MANAKTIKMCDMSKEVAATVFQMLNSDVVQLQKGFGFFRIPETVLVTDVEPKDLVYPEGWYYAKGCLRNKHTSTTGRYGEVRMQKSNGDDWGDFAKYCTLDL